MVEANEKLISLKDASKMTPYSPDYLGLLVRKGKLSGYKRDGKWYTTPADVENYIKRAAESSYEHQQSLNVKIPAEEIRRASSNLRWSVLLLAVVAIGALFVWKIMDDKKMENVRNKYRITDDIDGNITIYVNDPSQVKSVKVLSK